MGVMTRRAQDKAGSAATGEESDINQPVIPQSNDCNPVSHKVAAFGDVCEHPHAAEGLHAVFELVRELASTYKAPTKSNTATQGAY
jgi:hypothetical protein